MKSKACVMSSLISIYTDGACSGNPGPGGWGAILLADGNSEEISGGMLETTNNRMELLAAIKALEKTENGAVIDLYTDSIYVRDGISVWIKKWKTNNWKTSNSKPVKNVDLWKRLHQLNMKRKVNWIWVKGHSADFWNDRADELARAAILEIDL